MKTHRSSTGSNFAAVLAIAVITLAANPTTMAGQEGTQSPGASVPTVVQFSGVLSDMNGKPLSGTVGVTFLLYKDQQGGAPLWLETQNVQPDKAGRYSVMLGSTSNRGLPNDIFVAGEARWLAVQAQGQPEQPRVMLLSVPYALKAGDAETLGGLPVSAFALASSNAVGATSGVTNGTASPASTTSAPSTSSNVTTTGGTVNAVPLWTTATNIQSSALTQTGTGSTAKVGVNTTTPATTLDVKGTGTIRGALSVLGPASLPATGTATASGGKNSQPLDLTASAFNSSGNAAVNQTFQWQAEPANNDTGNPAGTLNLLFGSGTNKPTETGLNIASNGLIMFASGQTFPGTGTGTITGVTAGSGLLGGGTGGNVTLNVDTTKVPQLNTTNSFTGNQSVTGNVTASGTVSGGLVNTASGVEMGGIALAFESVTTDSVFLGATNNTTNIGNENTATGFFALAQNTSGSGNTATGVSSLQSNSTGSLNTAFGFDALLANSTGNGNTAVGASSLTGTTTSSYNTAIGDGSLFQNKTGTGNTAGGYDALTSNTTGEYSTASGYYALLSNTTGGFNTAVGTNALGSNTTGSSNTAIGDIALSANTTGSNNVAVGTVAGGASPNSALTTGNQNTYVGAFTSSGTQTNLTNATAIGAYAEVTENNAIVLGSINGVNSATSNVNVGIGTTAPAYALDVHGTGNFTGPITFAPGQTFPGTGSITGVTAGAGLTGGGTSGSVTVGLASNACSAGTALSALPFTCSPFATLGSNTFTGSQTVSGNLSTTGVVTGSGFQIGSNLFDYGNYNYQNAFLGFAGNTTMTGYDNTASGFGAFSNNTTGYFDTSIGAGALYSNTEGAYNSASGYVALQLNSTGLYNTASGAYAGFVADHSYITGSGNTFIGFSSEMSTGTLNNATAIGADAEVAANNAMVLGSINGVNAATADTNVGIGTTAPAYPLTVVGNSTYIPVAVSSPSTFGTWMTLANTSTGGATWNILSAAGGNSEGAGNLVFTNFNPNSTVYIHANLHVDGTVSKGGGSFQIDHPLDPANKYLYHSFVESPDMMNVYNGNITTNKGGVATVVLPEYFEALNRDFRYQLTVIGQFAQAIVAQEINHGRFMIKTSKPGVKVSWQVTGIRQDVYANAHRIPIEEEKPPMERGKYLHPELFGVSDQLAIGGLPPGIATGERRAAASLQSEEKH